MAASLKILVFFIGLSCQQNLFSQDPGTIIPQIQDLYDSNHAGCTVFTLSKGDRVFFGGNDDYIHADSHYWVDPGNDSQYGAIWIGQPDNVQQGVNIHMLAYDANGLPRQEVKSYPGHTPVPGSYNSYPLHILHECVTVEQVIHWVRTHQWHSHMHDQMHFADSTGDAVIISVGKKGEVAFTRKQAGDGFLISTNFNVANPRNGFGYPCWRYQTAQQMLDKLVKQEEPITYSNAANVLNAVHQEGISSWTLESMVADLTIGLVYLYYFYQYDKPVVLNVKEEIANPPKAGPLSNLFPLEIQEEAQRRYEAIKDQSLQCQKIGWGWFMLSLICWALFFIFLLLRKQKPSYWTFGILILGPVAFISWLIAGMKPLSKNWRISLSEAIGDLAPVCLAFIILLLNFVYIPTTQNKVVLRLFFVFIMPVLISWIIFQGPLIITLAGTSRSKIFLNRLSHSIVTANLGMAGINALTMPMINQSMEICRVMPFSAYTLLTWWAITVTGALFGGMLVFFYHQWAIKKEYRAWTLLTGELSDFHTPEWRELCWWIVFSYIILLAGIAIGVLMQ